MPDNFAINGYTGILARIDLARGTWTLESIDDGLLSQFIGGVGLAVSFLVKEVPPGTVPLDPENKIYLFTGPLAGTSMPGSGTSCWVTKSPMTNLVGSAQANGYLGAFLKTAGFDGMILENVSEQPVYIHVTDGRVTIRPANHLWGMGCFETEETILKEIGCSSGQASVYCIGPAGENGVRFAAVVGDQGHVVGHNGIGAVMGSKRIKAIAVTKGKQKFHPRDPHLWEDAVKTIREKAKNYLKGLLHRYGTAGLVIPAYKKGELPIKNYQKNQLEVVEHLDGTYIRSNFQHRPKTCHRCPIAHNAWIRMETGPLKGKEVEEPEYECLATLGSNLEITDPASVIYLTHLADDLGLNATETGWTISWALECRERGLLSSHEIELPKGWGDVEGIARLIHAIANRRDRTGILLSEGVRNAAKTIGGEAESLGVYTFKGGSPRGHDHRARWIELLDTCFSNTGTIEASFGSRYPRDLAPPLHDPFDAIAIVKTLATINGWRQFEDALGTCRFCTNETPREVCAALSALTGWDLDVKKATFIGKRFVHLMRWYNIQCGLTPSMERPSARYGSTPQEGPAAGKTISPSWDTLQKFYFEGMGWDAKTGAPTRETIQRFGLDEFLRFSTRDTECN